MDERELKEIEERLSKTPKGPWHWKAVGEKSNDAILGIAYDHKCKRVRRPGKVEDRWNERRDDYDTTDIEDCFAYMENDADYALFDFLAHSWTDVRRLVAEVRRLQAELNAAASGKE